MKEMRVVNLFGGPGLGKSTIAAELFAKLKRKGYNTEYVQEYAKDATWEGRGPKVFAAQEYIFGKQHFRLTRVAEEVDFAITDSPVLMSASYIPVDHSMPSLERVIVEAHSAFDNLNILLERNPDKPYNPKGRYQTEDEAKKKDQQILELLQRHNVTYQRVPFNEDTSKIINNLMYVRGWVKELDNLDEAPKDQPEIDIKIAIGDGEILKHLGSSDDGFKLVSMLRDDITLCEFQSTMVSLVRSCLKKFDTLYE